MGCMVATSQIIQKLLRNATEAYLGQHKEVRKNNNRADKPGAHFMSSNKHLKYLDPRKVHIQNESNSRRKKLRPLKKAA